MFKLINKKSIFLTVFISLNCIICFYFNISNALANEKIKILDFELNTKKINNTNYISLNELVKKAKLSIKYFPDSKMYKITDNNKREIKFVINKRAVVVDDIFIRSTAPILEIDGDAQIPIEIISSIYNVNNLKLNTSKTNNNQSSQNINSKTIESNKDNTILPLKPLPVEDDNDIFQDESTETEIVLDDPDIFDDTPHQETIESNITQNIVSNQTITNNFPLVIENIKYRRKTNSFELDIIFDRLEVNKIKHLIDSTGKNVDIVINQVESKLGEQSVSIKDNIVKNVKLTIVNQGNTNRAIVSLISDFKVNVQLKENTETNTITFILNKIDNTDLKQSDLKPLIESETQSVNIVNLPQTSSENTIKKLPDASLLKPISNIDINIANIDEIIKDIKDIDYIIAIDAGHGGEEFGVVSESGIKEKDITFDIARRLKAIMDKTKLKAILVRNGDYFMPLDSRIKMVNTYDTKLLISLHVGASNNNEINGINVYYFNHNAQLASSSNIITNQNHELYSQVNEILSSIDNYKKSDESYKLAESISNSIKNHKELKFKNIKCANFALLSESLIPSVIIEVGFLTSNEDIKLLKNDEYKNKLAIAIFNGIKKYILENKK